MDVNLSARYSITFSHYSSLHFELLCGSKIQDSDDDTDDSEWEEAES